MYEGLNPTDKPCWTTCVSCFRCADKGRYGSRCNTCSGRSDPYNRREHDPDDYCVLSTTPILVKANDKYVIKPMDKAVVGDLVYTDKARWRRINIIDTHTPYRERVSIKPYGSPRVVVTGNHPILTLDGFRNASELTVLTEVLYPINRCEHNIDYIDLLEFFNSGTEITLADGLIKYTNPKANWHNRFIKLNEEFFELLGLYAAEGSCGDHQVGWSYGAHEIELINRTRKLIYNIFGVRTSINAENELCHTSTVLVGSNALKELFQFLVPGIATTKSLNDIILNASAKLQKAFLYGYIQGDGGYSSKSYAGCWHIKTHSYALAWQVRDILLRNDIIANWQVIPVENQQISYIYGRPIIPTQSSHTLKVSRYEHFNRLSAIMNSPLIKTVKERNNLGFSEIKGNFLHSKIHSITLTQWAPNELVTNFTIDEDHTYSLASFATHNCRCREGVLQYKTQKGKLIVARLPNNPFKEGKVIQEAKTSDERDYDSLLASQREASGNPNWDPVRFEGGGSTSAWYDSHLRGK